MHSNKYNPNGKDIRFINSDYKTLFTVPDGGYINITLDSGEILTRQCQFHDECHTHIGSNIYHICEFAERMEQVGSTFAPCPEPEAVQGYLVEHRIPVGEKIFVLAHNPNTAQKYVTWQGYADKSKGYDWGHYWSNRSDAWADCIRRADSERTGRPYDHTQMLKRRQNHDKAR